MFNVLLSRIGCCTSPNPPTQWLLLLTAATLLLLLLLLCWLLLLLLAALASHTCYCLLSLTQTLLVVAHVQYSG
jgi:hypothetical protein